MANIINETLTHDFQQPDILGLVALFTLDIRHITGSSSDVYYFIEATISGTTVKYNDIEYFPVNIKTEGFGSANGSEAPRPKITIANVGIGAGVTVASVVNQYDDGIGGIVKRKITKRRYLDDGESPDPMAYWEETWEIKKKNRQSKDSIEFELGDKLYEDTMFLPGRIMLRDTCNHMYRYYDSGSFNYDNASCPWADSGDHGYYFDRTGTKVTSAEDDECGKRLSDCKLRYVRLNAPSYTAGTSPTTTVSGAIWLDTGQIPNVWYRYNGTDWVDPGYEELPTRACPMLSKVRIY